MTLQDVLLTSAPGGVTGHYVDSEGIVAIGGEATTSATVVTGAASTGKLVNIL